MKQNDVEDDDQNEDEMEFEVLSMPDQRNAIRKQGELIREGIAPHRTALHRTAPHRTARHRTARHGTAPHGTARHGTATHARTHHPTTTSSFTSSSLSVMHLMFKSQVRPSFGDSGAILLAGRLPSRLYEQAPAGSG